MNSRTFTRVLSLAALTLLVLAPHAARAQVTPDGIDKTQIRPSAHALGLGGSYLLLGDDPNGLITNPAAVASARHGSPLGLDLTVEGQTSNVNVTDLNNVANDISNINSQISNINTNGTTAQNAQSDLQSVQSVQGSINDLYNYATGAGATQNNQARISGSASFGAAARWTKVGPVSIGTVGYGGITADVNLNAYQDANNNGLGSDVVVVNGGALSLINIGVPIAYQLPGKGGAFGLTPKYVRADYTGASGTADEGNATLTGTSFKEVNASTFDLDAGYTSAHFNVAPTGQTPIDLQGAAVIHHLISPSFDLPDHVQNTYALTGQTAPSGPGNFNFTLHPELDLGAAAGAYGARLTVEEHNITSTNGGGKTFHVGAEYNQFKYVVPRIGYDNNAFVYGLGINILNYVQLDAAASTNVQQRLAADLSISLRF